MKKRLNRDTKVVISAIAILIVMIFVFNTGITGQPIARWIRPTSTISIPVTSEAVGSNIALKSKGTICTSAGEVYRAGYNYGCNNAIDGNSNTFWSISASGKYDNYPKNTWIKLDLAKETWINKIVLKSINIKAIGWIKKGTLTLYDSTGNKVETIKDITVPYGRSVPTGITIPILPKKIKSARLDVIQTWGPNAGLIEFEIYVSSASQDTCSDTDNGKNYNVKGTITITYTNGYKRTETDTCNPDGTLREWYCGNPGDPAGLLRSENYVKCPNDYMCSNGACILKTSKCNQNNFKIAFILLGNNPLEFTSERINKLNEIKSILSKDFLTAIQNKGSLDTSYIITTVLVNDKMKTGQEEYQFYPAEITKEFYKGNPDNFDFIIIFTAFNMFRKGNEFYPQYYTPAQNFVSSIGLPIYDNTPTFGSNGNLLGAVFIADIDRFYTPLSNNIAALSEYGLVSNILIHEVAHQWCCYVGDNFVAGAGNPKLEILENKMHFHPGLQLPSSRKIELMGSVNWIPNPSRSGTFMMSTLGENTIGELKIFHPFALYFMGLLPESEYNKKYQLFNTGLYNDGTFTLEFATPYKEVSVNDIISVEGKRNCN